MFKVLNLLFIFSLFGGAHALAATPSPSQRDLTLAEAQSYFAQYQPFLSPGCTNGQSVISGTLETGQTALGDHTIIFLHFDGGAVVISRLFGFGSKGNGKYQTSDFSVECSIRE
ncbi:hypothetical protein K2X30_13905 [bacterium]|jgi:hypothetical protein|nr:hypothetical protein [bacterium]